MLSRLYKLDHLYGLLLTFGLALIIQGLFRNDFGSSGQPYQIPRQLKGGINLGFMFLPKYRAWVIVASLVVCLADVVRDRAHQARQLSACRDREPGARAGIRHQRAADDHADVSASASALAAFAGVMAAPIYQVDPLMGADLIIVVFAVVVIGGMGSILGSIVTGFGPRRRRGPDQGVLSGGVEHRDLRDHGHRAAGQAGGPVRAGALGWRRRPTTLHRRGPPQLMLVGDRVMAALLAVAPFVGVYPVFLMKALCFALFACAFNLLLGFGGLLSFGHAMFLGTAGYVCAYAAKEWGCPPELAILLGTRGVRGCWAGSSAALAIRRAGHLLRDDHARPRADDVFLLPADAIHGRRRRHPGACRAAGCSASSIWRTRMTMYYVVLAIFLAGFLLIYRIDPFAVRPGAEGDPRERAARDLARLRRRPLQAARVRAVGDAGGARGRDQDHRVPARVADRRALADVGRGRADDAARRHGHDLRARSSARSSSSALESYLAGVRPMGAR